MVVTDYFNVVHEKGKPYEANATVYLYPWNENVESAVTEGGLAADAIKDALSQLYQDSALDFFGLYTLDTSDFSGTSEYPEWGDMTNNEYGGIIDNFKYYLREIDNLEDTSGNPSQNPTEKNLYNYAGKHLLVHDENTGCVETAANYAPKGAGAERHGKTAFAEGRVGWSPICANTELSEAAAIQETLHSFIHDDYDETNSCKEEQNGGYVRDHSLGTLNNTASGDICTPMLTYHWDDFDGDHREDAFCVCPVDRKSDAEGHTRELTQCTIDSIGKTGMNLDKITGGDHHA